MVNLLAFLIFAIGLFAMRPVATYLHCRDIDRENR